MSLLPFTNGILCSTQFTLLIRFLTFGTIITILAFAVATLHPQRTRIHYILDCIILLLLLLLLFSLIGGFLGPHNSILSMVSRVFGITALGFPLFYFIGLVIYWIGAKKRVPQQLANGITLSTAILRCAFKKGESNEHQPLLA